MNSSEINNFEKKIWIFWLQGWEYAPQIIKECKNSWIKNNPDWQIILLDKYSINLYIKLDYINKFKNLNIAHKSDLIRLELLEKYGGVWVDASLFCMMPLDNWLFNYLQSGIFLFTSSTNLTIIANWFIASKKNHITISRMKNRLTSYWIENNFYKLNIFTRFLRKVITPILNLNKTTSRLWLNPFVIKLFKIYPYQIFYFIFESIISKEIIHREIWIKTPKINKYICWPYQDPMDHPKEELLNRINNEFVPIMKLNWRGSNYEKLPSNSLISYLKNKYNN